MKKLLIVLASTFSAGIAAAQSPGCATTAATYTPVLISQATPSRSFDFGSGSTSNGSVINPIPLGSLSNSTVMVLAPTGGAGSPSVAAAMLVNPPHNPAASNGLPSTSSREAAAQITSMVYSLDSCTGNTQVRIYGQGFGLVSRPTVVLAYISAVCITGTSGIPTSYDAGQCAVSVEPTSYVPMIMAANISSWSENLIVLDAAITLAGANSADIMAVVTNNDTGTQTSFSNCYSSIGSCQISYTVNNSN